MPRHVLVPIANGCEEIEVTTITSVLKRAGAEVTLASCQPDASLEIYGQYGMSFKADCPVESCLDTVYQLIVLPGGKPSATCLRDTKHLTHLLLNQKSAGCWYAASGNAPAIVLSHHGLLDNTRATCHPEFIDKLEGAMIEPAQLVVVDQNKHVVTAQGAGCVMAFSFRLVEVLLGQDSYRPIATELVADWAL